MIPGKYNITIYKGSTWSISLGATDENDVATDFDVSYIDVPSAGLGTVRMYIRPAWRPKSGEVLPDALLELTVANGRISVSTTTITLTLTAAETAALEFSEGTYDLELVTGDAIPVVDKLLYGSVTVKDEKTV